MNPEGTYARIYAVVRRIPSGQVSTYGAVARVAGLAGRARQVGYALHALGEEKEVPWQRVVNARGQISLGAEAGKDSLQRQILEVEGVRFDERGRVDLDEFGWRVGR
ncbi:MAG: MGMT family protein [Myxococcota bacterium]|nr:MGMT family protein [Myxococcota bacterium]